MNIWELISEKKVLIHLVIVLHGLQNMFWSQRPLGSNICPTIVFVRACLVGWLTCCSPVGESCGNSLESPIVCFYKEACLNAYKTSLKCISWRVCSKHATAHEGLGPIGLCTWFHVIHSIFRTLSVPRRIVRLLRDWGWHLIQKFDTSLV